MTVNKKKTQIKDIPVKKTITKKTEKADKPPVRIPSYLLSVYKKFYMNHKWFSRFDKEWFANLSTFGFYGKIKKSVLDEIKPTTKVLVAGNSYGRFIQEMADKVGEDGTFDLVDVVPLQAKNAKDKLATMPQAGITLADIEFYYPKKSRKRIKYDLVIAFFLLHELPDKKKTRVLESLISLTTRSGKVLIVDYSYPKKYNLLKYPVIFVNRLIEPFAEVLLKKPIEAFTPNPEKYNWNKKEFCGGLYQTTTLKRKRV